MKALIYQMHFKETCSVRQLGCHTCDVMYLLILAHCQEAVRQVKSYKKRQTLTEILHLPRYIWRHHELGGKRIQSDRVADQMFNSKLDAQTDSDRDSESNSRVLFLSPPSAPASSLFKAITKNKTSFPHKGLLSNIARH